MAKKLKKIIALILSFCFLFESSGFAQIAGQLNISGHIDQLHQAALQAKFRPFHLRYLSYDNQNNNLKILLDKGDLKNVRTEQVKEAANKLLNYFFTGVTLPDEAFWVNLKPDAASNIIDDDLTKTDFGKILLEADLQLKKDTAHLTSPETPIGREYWNKLYQKAGELFGSDNLTIPTLCRPWIVPGEIVLRETKDNAYIYKATLKVMLEEDHLKNSLVYDFNDERQKELNTYASSLMRESILPELTKAVNTEKKYAPLRQVYYSLILARWFKARFNGKNGKYCSLIDRKNLDGLVSKEPWSKDTYFNEYVKSFKDGEYNLKEAVNTVYGQVIRTYFSGGIDLAATLPIPRPGMTENNVSSIVGNARRDLVNSVKGSPVVSLNAGQMGVSLNEAAQNTASDNSFYGDMDSQAAQRLAEEALRKGKEISLPNNLNAAIVAIIGLSTNKDGSRRYMIPRILVQAQDEFGKRKASGMTAARYNFGREEIIVVSSELAQAIKNGDKKALIILAHEYVAAWVFINGYDALIDVDKNGNEIFDLENWQKNNPKEVSHREALGHVLARQVERIIIADWKDETSLQDLNRRRQLDRYFAQKKEKEGKLEGQDYGFSGGNIEEFFADALAELEKNIAIARKEIARINEVLEEQMKTMDFITKSGLIKPTSSVMQRRRDDFLEAKRSNKIAENDLKESIEALERLKELKERSEGKTVGEIIKILREDCEKYNPMQLSQGLQHSAALRDMKEVLKKYPNIEFDPNEVIFVPTNSWIARIFQFFHKGGVIYTIKDSQGNKSNLVFISAELSVIETVKVILHEVLHKRFEEGRSILARDNPQAGLLYRILEEAMTEGQSIAIMEDVAQRNKKIRDRILGGTSADEKIMAMIVGAATSQKSLAATLSRTIFVSYIKERALLKAMGNLKESALQDIYDFLVTGDLQKLEALFGREAVDMLIKLSQKAGNEKHHIIKYKLGLTLMEAAMFSKKSIASRLKIANEFLDLLKEGDFAEEIIVAGIEFSTNSDFVGQIYGLGAARAVFELYKEALKGVTLDAVSLRARYAALTNKISRELIKEELKRRGSGVDVSFDGRFPEVNKDTFDILWQKAIPVSISSEHKQVFRDSILGGDFYLPEIRLLTRLDMPGRRVLRQGNLVLVEEEYWESLSEGEKLDILMHEAMADWMQRNRPDEYADDVAIDMEGIRVNEAKRREAHLGEKEDLSMDGRVVYGDRVEGTFSTVYKASDKKSVIKMQTSLQKERAQRNNVTTREQQVYISEELNKKGKQLAARSRLLNKGNKVNLFGEDVVLDSPALWQETVTPLDKALETALRNKDLSLVEKLLKRFVILQKEIWKQGFFDGDAKFENYGLTETGDLVIHDFDYVVSLDADKHKIRLLGDSILNIFVGSLLLSNLDALEVVEIDLNRRAGSLQDLFIRILKDNEILFSLVKDKIKLEQFISHMPSPVVDRAAKAQYDFVLAQSREELKRVVMDIYNNSGAVFKEPTIYFGHTGNRVHDFLLEAKKAFDAGNVSLAKIKVDEAVNLLRTNDFEENDASGFPIADIVEQVDNFVLPLLRQLNSKNGLSQDGENLLQQLELGLNGLKLKEALGYRSGNKTNTLEGYLKDKYEIVTVDLSSRNYFVDIVRALEQGKMVALNFDRLPLDVKNDYRHVNEIIKTIGVMLSQRFNIMRSNKEKEDAEFMIKEVIKNALYHGNRLDFSLLIYLSIEVSKNNRGILRLEVYDNNSKRKISALEAKKAKDDGLGGESVGVEEIMKDWDYSRQQIDGVKGTKVVVSRKDKNSLPPAPKETKELQNSAAKVGGIDFRATPFVVQPMVGPQPTAHRPQALRLNNSLDAEWIAIQNMLNSGIVPSTRRIKEYLEQCCLKEDANLDIDRVIGCIADILRIEEERVVTTNSDLKELLVVLESDKTGKDLILALNKINITSEGLITVEP
ncbi:MAG: hypothetical protein PHO70_01240 [Candidatus Omnitrophica bacterium]|nr:hypothetical protein [Candidatus Omnitrophota bacterium]